VVLFVLAGFFLASAMKRLFGWRRWAWPARWVAVLFLVLFVASVAGIAVDLGGLFQRLLAVLGAAGIALLAVGVLQRS
jgi:peptidoglycan/LPS O-acetylase OafA/YrhL